MLNGHGCVVPGTEHFGLKKLNVALVAGCCTGALSTWANVAQEPWPPLDKKKWKPTSPTVTGCCAPSSRAWTVWKRPDLVSAGVSTFQAALISTAACAVAVLSGRMITLFFAKASCLLAS